MRKNNKYIIITAQVEGEPLRCCINVCSIHKAIKILKEEELPHLYITGWATRYDKREEAGHVKHNSSI